MNLKKFFNTEEGGCIIFYIVLFITIPSLIFNILSCSDHREKDACPADVARISTMLDTISYMNMFNATAAACAHDESDSLENMYGENIHTGVIKLSTKDIEDNSLEADSLIGEIYSIIKKY